MGSLSIGRSVGTMSSFNPRPPSTNHATTFIRQPRSSLPIPLRPRDPRDGNEGCPEFPAPSSICPALEASHIDSFSTQASCTICLARVGVVVASPSCSANTGTNANAKKGKHRIVLKLVAAGVETTISFPSASSFLPPPFLHCSLFFEVCQPTDQYLLPKAGTYGTWVRCQITTSTRLLLRTRLRLSSPIPN